jgi:hypothetical protein
MIRRWSYINKDIHLSEFTGVVKAHRFKVFRKNTKFKKFNRGLIDFVRRKNIKRRRYMNYLTLSFLSSDWSKIYLNQRSIIRFAQSVYSHDFSLESVEPNLSIKLASKHGFTQGLHTASIPSHRALSITGSLKAFNINLTKTSFSRNALTSLNSFEKNTETHSAIGLSALIDSNHTYFLHKSSLATSQLHSSLAFTQPVLLNLAKCHRAILILTCLSSLKH